MILFIQHIDMKCSVQQRFLYLFLRLNDYNSCAGVSKYFYHTSPDQKLSTQSEVTMVTCKTKSVIMVIMFVVRSFRSVKQLCKKKFTKDAWAYLSQRKNMEQIKKAYIRF